MQLYEQGGEIGLKMGNRFVSFSSEPFSKAKAVPFEDESVVEFLEWVADGISFDTV